MVTDGPLDKHGASPDRASSAMAARRGAEGSVSRIASGDASSLEEKMSSLSAIFGARPSQPADIPDWVMSPSRRSSINKVASPTPSNVTSPVSSLRKPAESPLRDTSKPAAPADWWSAPRVRNTPQAPRSASTLSQGLPRASVKGPGVGDWWNDPSSRTGAPLGGRQTMPESSAVYAASTEEMSTSFGSISFTPSLDINVGSTSSPPPPPVPVERRQHLLASVDVTNELRSVMVKACERRYAFSESWTASCAVIRGCYDDDFSFSDVVACLEVLPLLTEGSVAVKALCLFHRLLLEGATPCLQSAIEMFRNTPSSVEPKIAQKDQGKTLSFLHRMFESWSKASRSRIAMHAWRDIILGYVKLLQAKVAFHARFPEFEAHYALDRFFRRVEIENQESSRRWANAERHKELMSGAVIEELLEILGSGMVVLESLISLEERMEVADSCIVPLLTDLSFNYQILEYLMTKAKSVDASLQDTLKTLHSRLFGLLRSVKFNETFVRSIKVAISSRHSSSRILSMLPEVHPDFDLDSGNACRPDTFSTARLQCSFDSLAALHKALAPPDGVIQ